VDLAQVARQVRAYLADRSKGPLRPDVCAALGARPLARLLRAVPDPQDLPDKAQRYLQVCVPACACGVGGGGGGWGGEKQIL
jgi:hypothetical protein